MPRIDEARPFLAVNIAILTVSDTRSESDDKSGQTLAELIAAAGHRVAQRLPKCLFVEGLSGFKGAVRCDQPVWTRQAAHMAGGDMIDARLHR